MFMYIYILCMEKNGYSCCFLSIKWNLIRLGSPTHGIVTKTVHMTMEGGEGVVGDPGGEGDLGMGVSCLFDMKLTHPVCHNCLN